MSSIAGLVSIVLFLQIPAPDAALKASQTLRQSRKAIIEGEREKIEGLIAKVGKSPAAAAFLKKHLPEASRADGASRIVLIPEVVPPCVNTEDDLPEVDTAPTWREDFKSIRVKAAKDLFALATKSMTLTPRHYAMADSLLRSVIEREPDNAESRRLLGQLPYEGGWATPFAVKQIKNGMTLHPRYGWVKSSWVPHLENGELPAPGAAAEGKERWLSVREANDLRKDFAQGWRISTEHFKIQTNVPLDEAIAFGQQLEALHEVFQSLFADVIGESLPLAQRFRQKSLVEEKAAKPHSVFYYADRAQYIEAVRPSEGDGAEISLGIYIPSESNRSKRGQAYFFRDQGGEVPTAATLFHEVSHQLLMESDIGKVGDFRKNQGNYWVFEGLGTYFETFTIEPDASSVLIGGFVGPRLIEARKNLFERLKLTPIKPFVLFGDAEFKSENIYQRYQQANALAAFLMQGEDGAYREDFLTYVRDACLGKLGNGSANTLERRLRISYSELESKLLAYLKKGPGN